MTNGPVADETTWGDLADRQLHLFPLEPLPPRVQLRRALRADPRALAGALASLERHVDNLTKEICALLLDHNEDCEDRLAACEALAVRPDPAAIPTLLVALVDVGPGFVRDAIAAHGPAAADHALESLTSPIPKRRLASVIAFGEIKDSRSEMALISIIRDQHPRLRNAACWALAKQRCAGAREALEHALKTDHNIRVRRAAAESLGLLQDSRAAGALAEAMYHDPAHAVRTSAVLGLGYLADDNSKRLLASGPADLHSHIQLALMWQDEAAPDEPESEP